MGLLHQCRAFSLARGAGRPRWQTLAAERVSRFEHRSALLQVVSAGSETVINVRNAVSGLVLRYQLNNSPQLAPQSASHNLAALTELQAGLEETKVASRSSPEALAKPKRDADAEAAFKPEYVVSRLPFVLYNPMHERLPGWEPVEVTTDAQKMLQELDALPVHNTHTVGVIYIPPSRNVQS